MRALAVSIAIVATLVLTAAVAVADIARPDDHGRSNRPKENTLRLVIEAGDNPEPQLWLPPEMRIAMGDHDEAGSGLASASTIASGTALSLSLAFGGLWLVRNRRTLGARAATGAGIVLVVVTGTAALALANAAPPRNYRTVDAGSLGLATPSGEPLRGEIRYYYGSDTGVVRLVLPRTRS